MKYKALMLDVDGTTIAGKDLLPSQRVTEAVAKTPEDFHVGIASGRPLFMLSHIFEHLRLNGPSIINDGAQIIDFPSKTILRQQLMHEDDVYRVCRYLQKKGFLFYIQDNDADIKFTPSYRPGNPYNIFSPALEDEEVDMIIHDLSVIPNIVIHKTVSWDAGKVGLLISHVTATKQHGIFEVAKILKIKTSEIIGIGDGPNDFPLLMACGLKVAMGNAIEGLKAIADYVAPSVEEDGVAHVIEKFVLNEK